MLVRIQHSLPILEKVDSSLNDKKYYIIEGSILKRTIRFLIYK